MIQSANGAALIEFKGVTKIYGEREATVRALDGVDLQIALASL